MNDIQVLITQLRAKGWIISAIKTTADTLAESEIENDVTDQDIYDLEAMVGRLKEVKELRREVLLA
jgi:hypothetical protein